LATESTELTDRKILESLLQRERLGSTGLGKGIAIPHARVADCKQTLAAFLHVEQGIDYDAMDKKPVDLFFALIVPEDATQEHLEFLAQLAEMFNSNDFCQKLRETDDCREKYTLLSQWQSS